MNALVFLEDQSIRAEPFTTSKIVAEVTGVTPKKIRLAISKHKTSLEVFGLLAPYGTESTGGRPEMIWKLNEQQAVLLITFLKNTPAVVAFKTELVRQFYTMRKELTKRQIARAQSKPPQRTFTDVIKACTPPEHLHPYTYQNYINMAFKAALGRNAKQLRKERNIPDTAIIEDFMTAAELDNVDRAKANITALLLEGTSYYGIKAVLLPLEAVN